MVTTALCWGTAALALSITSKSLQRKSKDNATAVHKPRAENVKSTSHFLTQIVHRILRRHLSVSVSSMNNPEPQTKFK